jgi:hypothetical protein
MGAIKAQAIGFFLCPDCNSVHIGFWRNGVMFAEAIPGDIDAVNAEFQKAIADSKAAQSPVSPARH